MTTTLDEHPNRSEADRVAEALKAAAAAALPTGVDAVDYDESPTNEHRHVQVSVERIPESDGTSSQARHSRRYRVTAAAIADTVGNARLYLDLVDAAWERKRIEVAPDRLTGPIKFETQVDRGRDDDTSSPISSYTFTLGARR